MPFVMVVKSLHTLPHCYTCCHQRHNLKIRSTASISLALFLCCRSHCGWVECLCLRVSFNWMSLCVCVRASSCKCVSMNIRLAHLIKGCTCACMYVIVWARCCAVLCCILCVCVCTRNDYELNFKAKHIHTFIITCFATVTTSKTATTTTSTFTPSKALEQCIYEYTQYT